MPSRSSMAFLQRQRIFPGTSLHTAKYYPGASAVHRRPIVYSPYAFGPDTPATRVLTQIDKQRLPYQPVVGTDQPCETCVGEL